jgi:hypothetical protein
MTRAGLHNRRINVSIYLSEEELESLINAISSKEHTFAKDSYYSLFSSLNQAKEQLNSSILAKPTIGNCKYCSAQIIWINHLPFQAILPARANPSRTNINIERHQCTAMINAYKPTST